MVVTRRIDSVVVVVVVVVVEVMVEIVMVYVNFLAVGDGSESNLFFLFDGRLAQRVFLVRAFLCYSCCGVGCMWCCRRLVC